MSEQEKTPEQAATELQRKTLGDFFAKLNGRERREIRRVAARVTGTKESFSEMMARTASEARLR